MRLAPSFLRPADVRPAATAAPPGPLEPVLLVHGTFANAVKAGALDWWRPGSEYTQKLDAQLQQAGSPARCWAHLAGGSTGGAGSAAPYAWTGANSEHDRRQAGHALAHELAALEADSDIRRYHLVAHSHGGNVVLNALREMPRAPVKLGAVVYMGTPCLHFRHGQWPDFRWLSIPMYLAAIAVLAWVGWPADELQRLWCALSLAALVLAVVSEALLARRTAPRGRRADALYGSGRAQAFVFAGDEAINGLRFAQTTAKGPRNFIEQFASNAPPKALAVPVTNPPATGLAETLATSGIAALLDLLEDPPPAPYTTGLVKLPPHAPAPHAPGQQSPGQQGRPPAADGPLPQALLATVRPVLQLNVGGITLALFLKLALWICLLAPRLAVALVLLVAALLRGATAHVMRLFLMGLAQRVSSWALPSLIHQGAFGADEGRFEAMTDLPPGVDRAATLSPDLAAEAAAVTAELGGLAGRSVLDAIGGPDAFSIKAYIDRALSDARLTHSHYYRAAEVIEATAAWVAQPPRLPSAASAFTSAVRSQGS